MINIKDILIEVIEIYLGVLDYSIKKSNRLFKFLIVFFYKLKSQMSNVKSMLKVKYKKINNVFKSKRKEARRWKREARKEVRKFRSWIKKNHIFKFKLPIQPAYTVRLPSFNFRIRDVALLFFIYSIILILGSFLWLFYIKIIYTLPEINIHTLYRPKLTTYIYDREGNLIYKTFLDENRTIINVDDLSLFVSQAFISIEDTTFYNHTGVDLHGMVRAFIENIRRGQITQGGSTITQQLVKNAILDNSKTYERKVKEVILAIQLEQKYSKKQILEMYLNTVNFGGNAYGIEEASLMYFNKSAKYLNLEEASFLAALPVAPTTYNPYFNKDATKLRQKEVLNLMYKNKYISKNVAQETYKKPINIFYKTSKKLYPHFIDFILEEATTRYGRNAVYNGGLRIFTSIDAQMQNFAQNIVTNEIASLKRYKVQNGASLVTKNKTGEILAMVGSKNYYDISIDGFVNLTTALRQPGSSIKPFNYSLAFNTWLSPTTILEDTPVTYSVKGSKPWSPKNYDNTYRGKVTASFALANSLNIPSVKVLNKNGIENFVEYVKKFGIDSWNNDYYGLSLALGAAEVQMTQMAGAYSTFANEGVFVPINPILYTLNNTGDVIDFNECIYSYLDFDKNNTNHSINKVKCGKEATSKENAYIIKSILSNNNLRSSAFGFNSVLNVAGTAVKTGTTNNLRDNWTFGFNNEYMVSSWVGNNDNTPMSSIASGITGASPIWAKIIKNVTKPSNYLDLTRIPSNMVKVEICAATNTLACAECRGHTELFIKGTEPKIRCDKEMIERLSEKLEQQ